MCPCVRLSVCVPKKFMYCIKSHMFVFLLQVQVAEIPGFCASPEPRM